MAARKPAQSSTRKLPGAPAGWGTPVGPRGGKPDSTATGAGPMLEPPAPLVAPPLPPMPLSGGLPPAPSMSGGCMSPLLDVPPRLAALLPAPVPPAPALLAPPLAPAPTEDG